MRTCFDGPLKRRVVEFKLATLIHNLAHGGAVRLLVVIHPMLRVGNHTLALDADHRGIHQRATEDGILAGDVLKVAAVARNTCNTDAWTELDVGALVVEFFAHRGCAQRATRVRQAELKPWRRR